MAWKRTNLGKVFSYPLLSLAALLNVAGFQASANARENSVVSSSGDNSGLSRFEARTIDRYGPFEADRRWSTYRAMSELFDRFWRRPTSRRTLFDAPSKSLERSNFLIEDRDEDGSGEFFVLYPRGGNKNSQDFGAYFDLSGDGEPDWIVFYGGTAMTSSGGLFWWHQHGIDSNADGGFDIRVVGMIDMDGDGFPEEDATAWVYDSDHDGLIDRAEHIVEGRVTEIEPVNGYLPLNWVISPELEKQPRVGDAVSSLFGLIAADIDAQTGS